MRAGQEQRAELNVDLSRDEVHGGRRAALVRDVDHVDAGDGGEQGAAEVGDAAGAGRTVVDASRLAPGVGNEFLDRFRGHRGMDHHHVGLARGLRDRRQVPEQVVRQLGVEPHVDRMARGDHGDRVAVRGRLGRDVHADSAVGAGPIVGDDRLPPALAQFLRYRARRNVGAATRRERDD